MKRVGSQLRSWMAEAAGSSWWAFAVACLMTLVLLVASTSAGAQQPGSESPANKNALLDEFESLSSDSRPADLRFDSLGGGRYRVQSTNTTLAEVFRQLALTSGVELRATDELRRLTEARVPTIDLADVTLDELLEFLGGAFGIETYLLDGSLSLEVRTDPAAPSGWSERKEAAISILRRALLRYPTYSQAWKAYLQIGDMHFRDRMYDEAISEYRMILGMNAPMEGLAAAKLALGRAYLASNDPARARFYLLDFTRRHPRDGRFVEAYEMIAETFLRDNDAAMASRTLTYLLENDLTPQQYGRVQRLKGRAAALAGRYEESAMAYRAALEAQLTEEDAVEVGIELARSLLEAGRDSAVVAAVAEFLDRSGSSATRVQQASAWGLVGQAYRNLEMPAEEFLSFHRAHALAPDAFVAVDGWARALTEAGLLDRAAEVLARYEPEPSERTTVAARLGFLYEELGLLEKARSAYAKLLDDPRRRFEGVTATARILERREEHEACLRLVRGYGVASPEEERALSLIAGRCLVALGRSDEAIDLFVGRATGLARNPAGGASTEDAR